MVQRGGHWVYVEEEGVVALCISASSILVFVSNSLFHLSITSRSLPPYAPSLHLSHSRAQTREKRENKGEKRRIESFEIATIQQNEQRE